MKGRIAKINADRSGEIRNRRGQLVTFNADNVLANIKAGDAISYIEVETDTGLRAMSITSGKRATATLCAIPPQYGSHSVVQASAQLTSAHGPDDYATVLNEFIASGFDIDRMRLTPSTVQSVVHDQGKTLLDLDRDARRVAQWRGSGE